MGESVPWRGGAPHCGYSFIFPAWPPCLLEVLMVAQPKRVTVWWDDAHATEKNVDHGEAVGKYHAPYPVATTGWLVKRDKTGVSVARNWNPPHSKFESWDYRDLHFVPSGVIKKVEVLMGKRTKRKKAEGKAAAQKKDEKRQKKKVKGGKGAR